MADQERLHELLLKWQERRDQGHILAAEELCAQDPQLLALARERIAVLLSMENFLKDQAEGAPKDHAKSAAPLPIPKAAAQGPASGVDLLGLALNLHLLSADQAAIWKKSSAVAAKKLTGDLIQAGVLTPFQGNLLLQGRGQELLLGAYVLLQRLGEGGMGAVYKARNWKLDRVVALKVIRKERLADPQILRRFVREIQIAAQLDHPNIVRALDADCAGNTHFLVMEHIEGIDLARLVRQQGPLPVAQACDCIRQAALGLQHAFERGLVHRDIKPHNLLIQSRDRQGAVGQATLPDGRGSEVTLKILDLGLARLSQLEDTESSSALTQEGSVMGTPDYISPEQARNSHTADIRADLYSLGCTFHFLLTGRPPFPGGTLTEKLVRHWQEAPPDLSLLGPDVPAGVAAIVRKLVAKKPEDRHQTPGELAEVLANPGSGTIQVTPTPAVAANPFQHLYEDATAIEPAPGPPATKGFGGKRAVWAGVAALGALLVVLAFLFNPFRGQSPDPSPVAMPDKERLVFQVRADQPWQDTGIDLTQHQEVKVTVKGQWSKKDLGNIPAWGVKGFASDRCVLLGAPAVCLLGRVGDQEPFALGTVTALSPSASGRLFVQANDLDLTSLTGGLELVLEGAAGKVKGDPRQVGPSHVQRAEQGLLALFAQDLDVKTDRVKLREALVAFLQQYADTPQAQRAWPLWHKVPSPFDALDPAKIPAGEKFDWQPKELVGVIGSHARRHWGQIYRIVASAKGDLLASYGADGVRLWDPATMAEKALVPMVGSSEYGSVNLAHDGKRLMHNEYGVIRISNIRGAKLQSIGHIQSFFYHQAFTPDGQHVVTRNFDKPHRYEVWEITNEKLRRIRTIAQVIPSSYFQVVSDTVIVEVGMSSTGKSWQVRLIDISGDNGKVLHGLEMDTPEFAVSPDGKWFAHNTEYGEKKVRLFDISGGKFVEKGTFLDAKIINRAYNLHFLANGRELLFAETGNWWGIRDLVTGTTRQIVTAGPFGHMAVIAPDGKSLIGRHENLRELIAFDVTPDGKATARFKDEAPWGIKFCPESGRAVSWGKVVERWDFGGPIPTRAPIKGAFQSPFGGTVLPDGRVFSSVDGSRAALFDPAKGDAADPIPLPGVFPDLHLSTASPSGRRLAVSRHTPGQRSPLLFNLDGKQPSLVAELTECPANSHGVLSLTFSPGDQFLYATVLADGGYLWDLRGPQPKLLTKMPGASSAAFALDRPTLAVGDGLGKVRLFDYSTGTFNETHDLQPLARPVASVVPLPGGRSILTCDDAGNMKEVELAKENKTLREWQPFPGPFTLKLATDGRHLVCENGNGTLYVLRLRPLQ